MFKHNSTRKPATLKSFILLMPPKHPPTSEAGLVWTDLTITHFDRTELVKH